jgi:surface antigen
MQNMPPMVAMNPLIASALLAETISQTMQDLDKITAVQAMMSTPIGQEANWTNSRTAFTYVVRPLSEYNDHGTFCRRSEIMVNVKGNVSKTYHTICNRNGTWYGM